MKPIAYGIRYLLRYRLRRDHPPLICGLVLTNRCNLRCRHCGYLSYAEIDQVLKLKPSAIVKALKYF